MSKKTVRAPLASELAVEAQERRDRRQRERRAALARYTVQARIYALYEDASLGRLG